MRTLELNSFTVPLMLIIPPPHQTTHTHTHVVNQTKNNIPNMLHHYAQKSFDLYFHVNISVSNSYYLHSSTCPNLCTTWYLIKSNRTASMYLCQLLKLKCITYLNYSESWKGNSLWNNIYVPSLNFNLYIPQKQKRWRRNVCSC